MMRRLAVLFVATVFFAAGLPAFGQAGGWSLELGVSPGMMDRNSTFSEIRDLQYSSTYVKDGHKVSYKSYPVVLPTFSIHGGYVIPNTPVGVFMGVYCSYASNNLNGGPSPLLEQETILHFLPEVRLYYVNDPDFRLYATLGAGVRYRQYSETFEGDSVGNHDYRFSYEISPLGFSVGGRWFFSLDFGGGFPWMGGKLSVGTRF